MLKFFHRLFNPHCPECADHERELCICNECEYLKLQISLERQERQKLIDALLALQNKSTAPLELPQVPENYTPISGKFIPWRVQQARLEQEDRAKVAAMREEFDLSKQTSTQTIADLEKELLGDASL